MSKFIKFKEEIINIDIIYSIGIEPGRLMEIFLPKEFHSPTIFSIRFKQHEKYELFLISYDDYKNNQHMISEDSHHEEKFYVSIFHSVRRFLISKTDVLLDVDEVVSEWFNNTYISEQKKLLEKKKKDQQ